MEVFVHDEFGKVPLTAFWSSVDIDFVSFYLSFVFVLNANREFAIGTSLRLLYMMHLAVSH